MACAKSLIKNADTNTPTQSNKGGEPEPLGTHFPYEGGWRLVVGG